MSKSISVVIPTYNGLGLLKKYLPPLFEALHGFLSQVIVVDDASTDSTCIWLKKNYPQVTLLVNETNRGFADTINRGVFTAENDLVLCLNNDMEVASDFFTATLPFFEDSSTFAVMSQIMDMDGFRILESRKRPYLRTGMYYVCDDFENSDGFSLYVCGGNGLYCRDKLQTLGGFPTLYAPCYFEDVHLTVKAWSVGWKSYCTTATRCYHMHSATMKSVVKQELIDRLSYRNPIIFNYYFSEESDRVKIKQKYGAKRMLYSLFPFSRRKKLHLQAINDFFSVLPTIEQDSLLFDKFCSEVGLMRVDLKTICNLNFI